VGLEVVRVRRVRAVFAGLRMESWSSVGSLRREESAVFVFLWGAKRWGKCAVTGNCAPPPKPVRPPCERRLPVRAPSISYGETLLEDYIHGSIRSGRNICLDNKFSLIFNNTTKVHVAKPQASSPRRRSSPVTPRRWVVTPLYEGGAAGGASVPDPIPGLTGAGGRNNEE
jgi:hypothetical protein